MEKGILICVHKECNKPRILNQMNDMLQHNDTKHKVVDFKQFAEMIKQKYQEPLIKKMAEIVTEEQKLITKIGNQAKVLRQQIKQHADNETKKIQQKSLAEILGQINIIKKNENLKDLNSDLVKNLLNFENEKLPKFSNKLKLVEQKFTELNEKVSQLVKDSSNYSLSLKSQEDVKWSWSDTMKAQIYSINSINKKIVENQSSFLGWSFICIAQPLTYKAIAKINLNISENKDKQEKQQTYSQNKEEKSNKNSAQFALGITHDRQRAIKGFEQQDLSVIGHGFYLLRSDGHTIHNSDREINWKGNLAFKPEPGIISMTWNPNDSELLIEQGKSSFKFKVDKSPTESFHYCVHLKGCRAQIEDK